MKYDTPREVAFYVAFYVAAVSAILLIPLLLLFTDGWQPWIFYLITILAIFGVGILTLNYGMERFIHRKIKLIYKTIHRLKTQRNTPKPIDFNTDVLSEVNKEVVEWAKDNREEIAQLRKQEEFRKEFIGNLSHELKTPVFTLQGYLLTLLEGGLEDPDINRNYLDRADKNLDRLINLINELDEITKLESGETLLEYERFDLVKLTEEVLDEVEYKARKSGIRLSIKDPKKSVSVEADRSKVAQVITNLIINSIKYGKSEGETRVKFYDMDENVLVEVEDNGVGIAEEHLPRLFERFYRVDKSRARNQGGSGLGLAIVKHIIDAHNQSLSVRSQEGEGSTFSFTLKRVKA